MYMLRLCCMVQKICEVHAQRAGFTMPHVISPT